MLVLAPFIAALFFPARVLPTTPPRPCPTVAMPAYPASGGTCSALEVSGRVDATGATLDPAFDENVAIAKFAKLERGDATLSGFGADGRLLFDFPCTLNGPFDLYLPMPLPTAQALRRLRLSTPGATLERSASTHGEPTAEAIAVDDAHFVLAWDASAFPAIRIAATPNASPFAFGGGTSTYQQLNVESGARLVSVEFSDGVRSVTRAVRIFGR